MDLHDENRPLVPTLTTDRLTLRPYRASDVDAVVAALNCWDVTRWLTAVPYPYGAADFEWYLTEFIPQTRHVVWVIEGSGGLMGAVSVDSELGYWLVPHHHGKGLMTEAATAVCDWRFARDQSDLPSGYLLGNVASCNVLTKLGFKPSHIDRDVITARGDKVDSQRMILTFADWQARHG